MLHNGLPVFTTLEFESLWKFLTEKINPNDVITTKDLNMFKLELYQDYVVLSFSIRPNKVPNDIMNIHGETGYTLWRYKLLQAWAKSIGINTDLPMIHLIIEIKEGFAATCEFKQLLRIST